MHQTNKLKTEACLQVLREAGGELRIFMLDKLHVAYQEGISQEILSLFVKMIHTKKNPKNSFLTAERPQINSWYSVILFAMNLDFV